MHRSCGGNAPYRRIFKFSPPSFRFVEPDLVLDSNILLQRIVIVSSGRAPDPDVAGVITEVFRWLENESDALNAVSHLLNGIEAAIKPSSPH